MFYTTPKFEVKTTTIKCKIPLLCEEATEKVTDFFYNEKTL
jgi:hypothetical protein